MLFVIERELVGTQSDLCATLGLARATVCEMLQVLEALELVSRCAYRRTKSVMLTKRGAQALDAAVGGCIDSGDVTVAVDAAITREDVTVDPYDKREEILRLNFALRRFFGDKTNELHQFDWYDNLGLTWFELRDDDERGPVPWVDEVMLPRATFSG